MKNLYLFLCFLCFCLSVFAQEPFQGKKGKYIFKKTINHIESEIIVSPKYDGCNHFIFNPFTEVKLNGEWGFIDINGHEITPVKYDFCRSFSNG